MFFWEFLSEFSFELCLGEWATFPHDTAKLHATFNAHFWCLKFLNDALDTVDISVTFQSHWFMTFNFKPLYLLINHSRKTPMVKFLFNKVADLYTCNFIKKRLQHRCFPVNIAMNLRSSPNTEAW